MEPRIGIALSALEALLAVAFLALAVRAGAAGENAIPWYTVGGLLLATSLYTLTRGIRTLRRTAPQHR
ncbi:hypothetical protein ACWDR0_12060 [Streptomyces sp. NPDC003691]